MSYPALEISGLRHRYGERQALDGIEFHVEPAEIFGLLGPNGGGKTTLFRLVTTLLPVQEGTIRVLGHNVQHEPDAVRRLLGVTFQSPSLDGRLTVGENLKHQAHLYGLSGRAMLERIDELLSRLGLTDRVHDRADALSGGLKRRVEIAKGLLHDPQLLLLDEPSTGLDPGARHDLWRYLEKLRSEQRVTIVVTTHLMEEAERCDRLAILDRGHLVALGTPDDLRSSVGGDCITIHSDDPEELSRRIATRFAVTPQRIGSTLRIEQEQGHDFLRDLVAAFPDDVKSVSLGKPTLEDVFIDRTGHQFWDGEGPASPETSGGEA